ncbi:hypothetical protein D3C72_1108600 [compost metagenome]
MGAVALGGDHDARGVLVQPVNDAGAGDAAYARQAVAAVGQKGVDQGAGLAAGGGVGGHAGGLVDDDQVGVLEQDRQGDGLGLRRGGDDRGHDDGVETGLGLGRAAGDRLALAAHGALGQQGLKPGARQGREGGGQGLVEADAGRVDLRLENFRVVVFRQQRFIGHRAK